MRSRNWFDLIFIFASMSAFGPATAQTTCTTVSGLQRATFIELYTSEGCDSCPPADRWLSTLKNRSDIVPLSLHVDYWDYIGWKDPYAQKQFVERHKMRVTAQDSRSIYTPQVMVNGRDFSAWRTDRSANDIFAMNQKITAPLVMRVRATPSGSDVRVEIDVDGSKTDGLHFTSALYEHGLTQKVTAGENKGVTLNHDFVVRHMQRATNKVFTLPVARGVQLKNVGVAIIAETARGEYVQAVRLDLAACSKG